MAGLMLDADTCIYAINRRPPEVRRKFEEVTFGRASLSAVVAAELWAGVARSPRRESNESALKLFLTYVQVLDWPVEAAIIYGEIRRALESSGKMIGAFDMLIAAHALARDATLITNNVAEFRRIDGLRVETWVNR